MYPKAVGGLVKPPEGHLITKQPQSHVISCNIIVTETIGTLLGDLTIAEME